jgi:hypothetical protein
MRKALVLSLIVAVGLGFSAFAQTLSGHWDTDITIDLTAGSTWPDALTITSEIVIDYTVGDWTFSSETDIEDGAWTNQDFDFVGVLGAFTISGDIEFDPSTVAFVSLEANVSVSIAGVTFGAAFDLVPNGTDLTLTGSGTAGDVGIAVEVVLGDEVDCDFDFNSVEIDVDFPFCCADISAELVFTCAGFDYVEFCFDALTIENLPWLTLAGCVKFQTDSKVFTFEPEIDLGVIGCDFDLFYRLVSTGGTNYDPLLIDGIQFDGIQIACEIGGVAFTGITYWGVDDHGPWYAPGSPGILYGYEEYWEAYQIATTDDGCCGPFSFDVTVFFDEDDAADGDDPAGADELFDVAYLVANMEIQVATQFTFSLGLETDLEAGEVNNLTFGFLVEW